MQPRSLSHLSNQLLTQALLSLVARDRATTAELLAHLAEFDARRLHRPAGFSSLYEYCVKQLGMSGDVAFDRIAAARVARRCPAVLIAISDGRLSLTAVVMLSRYIEQAPQRAEELLRAAERRTKAEVALLIATHFPREDVPSSLVPVVVAPVAPAHSELPGEIASVPEAAPDPTSPVPERVEFLEIPALARQIAPPAPSRPTIAPLSAERYALHCTISRELHEKLGRVRELLSHAVPSGDVVQLIERCVDRFLARADRHAAPRTMPGDTPRAKDSEHRRVPIELRRLVQQRDGGRCTFVSESGHRCESRARLEIDHVIPVASGGRTELCNLRLLCQAHNQFMAERELGSEFMRQKRAAASEHREFERSRERARSRAREAG